MKGEGRVWPLSGITLNNGDVISKCWDGALLPDLKNAGPEDTTEIM